MQPLGITRSARHVCPRLVGTLVLIALVVCTAGGVAQADGSTSIDGSLSVTAGDHQTATVGQPFDAQLAVQLSGLGELSGKAVTFTAPSSGPSVAFDSTGTNTETVNTDSGGNAIAAVTANSSVGTYTVKATVDYTPSLVGLPDTHLSVEFTLTNLPATPALPSNTILQANGPDAAPVVPYKYIGAANTYNSALIQTTCGEPNTLVIKDGFVESVQEAGASTCWASAFTLNSTTGYTDDEAQFIYAALQQCAESTPFSSNYQDAALSVTTGDRIQEPLFGLTQAQMDAGIVVSVPAACNQWYVMGPLAYQALQSWAAAHTEIGGGNDQTIFVPAGTLDRVANLVQNQNGTKTYLAPGPLSGDCNTGNGCLFNRNNVIFTLEPLALAKLVATCSPTCYYDGTSAADAAVQTLVNDTAPAQLAEFDSLASFYGYIEAGCPAGQDLVLGPPRPGDQLAGLNQAIPECIAFSSPTCKAYAEDTLTSLDSWNVALDTPTYGGPQGETCDTQQQSVWQAQACETLHDPVPGLGCTPFVTMDGDGNVSLNNSVHGSGLSGNTGVLSPVSGKAIVRQSAATTPDPEQSASVVSSSSRNALTGQEVTYTFTVPQFDASAAGRVQFTDGGSAIAGCGAATVDTSNGNATCTVTYAHPGAHAVQAGYLGDPLNPPAFSHGLLQETVQPASTTSALSVSPANPVAGQQVTYTMSVDTTSPGQGTATGSVAFSEDGTPIDGCGAKSLDDSGSATCTVTYAHPSQHLIGASYGGDGDRVGSDAASLDVTVQQAPTTTNVYVTDPANGDAVVGQPVTYTASVSSSGSGNPTGTVAFSDGGNAIASCASQQVDPNGDATCTITSMSPRTESISAVYSGGSDYLGSSSKTVSETVDPAPTATAISSSPSSSQYGQQVTFTAVVSVRSPGAGTPSGTVTFTSGDGTSLGSASLKDDGNGHQVASISTDALHAGADQVTAAYGGDANYKGSSQSLTQTVAKAPTAIALQSPSVIKSLVTFKVTTVATLTSTVTGKGIPGQTVTFTVGTKQICTAITDATGTATCESKSNLLAPLLPGTPVTAAFAGTSDYAASEASAKAHLA